MLYREIRVVYLSYHTEHIRTICAISVEFPLLNLAVLASTVRINPLKAELNSICNSQFVELFCEVFKFCACFSKT